MIFKYEPTNYLEKKLQYAPTFEYEHFQLNPGKGLSYKGDTNSEYQNKSMDLDLSYSQ